MAENIPAFSKGVVGGGKSKTDIGTLHGSRKSKMRIEEEEGERLLPGIPDDITVNQVATKLPWTAFRALALVSHAWKQAIQGHQVYDARVRSKSTQTLVVMQHRDPYPNDHLSKLVIYSVKDGSSYHLPSIPGSQQIPVACQCISLDGKLYVLGGFKDPTIRLASASVYVLDVVGQGGWKECTSMAVPRADFGCDAFDGKIYVFGGNDSSVFVQKWWVRLPVPVCQCEVYDPKEDTWSPITPMPSFRSNPEVMVIGEELFVYNGQCYDADKCFGALGRMKDANYAEVYHPLKDEWRTLENFNQNPEIFRVFGNYEKFVPLMVGGEPHILTSGGFYAYDIHVNSWTLSQLISFDEIDPRRCYRILGCAIAVDDVLLQDLRWRSLPGGHGSGGFIMKSQGLGGENKKIIWRKTEYPCSELMRLIQL